MKFNVDDEIRIIDWGYDYNGNKIEPGRPGKIYDTVKGKSCYVVKFFRDHLSRSPEWKQYALVSGGNLIHRKNIEKYVRVSKDFVGVNGEIIKEGWLGTVKQYYPEYDGYVVEFIVEYDTTSNKRKRYNARSLIGEYYLENITGRIWSMVNETVPTDPLKDIMIGKGFKVKK